MFWILIHLLLVLWLIELRWHLTLMEILNISFEKIKALAFQLCDVLYVDVHQLVPFQPHLKPL